MKKTIHIISSSLIILTSMLTAQNTKVNTVIQTQLDSKLTKDNVYDKILLVVNKNIEFDEISVTYDELLDNFSNEFKDKFIEEDGGVFSTLLPKWNSETKEDLANICSSDETKILDKKIKADKTDSELTAYSGEILIKCQGEELLLKFAALETKSNFYVTKIQ